MTRIQGGTTHGGSHLLQERYGTERPGRRKVIVTATTLVAIVFLAWVAWVAIFHGDPAIDAKVSSFDVVDAHTTNVQLDTHFRDSKVKGNCLIRATAQDHTIVGELNLNAAQLRAFGNHWIPIRTERRATTAEVVSCK